MLLIIGLGNPGKEYEKTRHNAGRDVVMDFAKAHNFPEFRTEKKWKTLISEGNIGKEKIILALPDTLMNNSGKAAGPIAVFYKIKPAHIFLVHDDADIALGSAKLSYAKRSAGHKGVDSVIRALKTNEFWRFRIGIAGKRDIPADRLVLKHFTPDEVKLIKKIAKKTLVALEIAITTGGSRAMNEYNS
ncbi:MAG: aminoacyl-tRNA hydrolase [bacterium]|nr:aminoacyl-tRNA hydrolase [bacterium]MDZ4299385.1 aminoacyl-tRNA hydrolase [Candidatus Sungbacteria bacterium]